MLKILKTRTIAKAMLACCASLSCCHAAVAQTLPRTQQAPAFAGAIRADLVVVADSPPWMVSLATPALTKVTRTSVPPTMLVVGANPGEEAVRLIERLDSRRSLLIWPRAVQPPDLRHRAKTVVRVEERPLAASLKLAERFWGTSEQVVVAALEDPADVLMASSLAARLALPLIVYDMNSRPAELAEAFDQLRAKRLMLCENADGVRPRWTEMVTQKVERLDAAATEARIIEDLVPSKVRNIVLARKPDEGRDVGPTAWLAPYLTLKRRAVLVLTESHLATDARDRIDAVTDMYKLRPRTVTILADYDSIGTDTVSIRSKYGDVEFDLQTEPCVPTDFDEVAAVGVGRIPFSSREDASVLLARGFARKKLLGDTPPRALMLADLSGDLKLCQTVSRATAAELKNVGVHVDEFYQHPANSPEARGAAVKAHLILYEGHLSQQHLFDDPEFFMDEGVVQNHQGHDETFIVRTRAAVEPLPVRAPLGTRVLNQNRSQLMTIRPIAHRSAVRDGATLLALDPMPDLPPLLLPDKAPEHVDGLPVVVLQSCHSLEDPTFRRIHQCGAVAMVGSVTNIHSASGSAFIKAFTDNLLYRNSTLGEALRDARNYFFCLHDLKNRRGHREQAKSQRVALSFRMWGDPELRAFPQQLSKPARRLVTAKWDGVDQLAVKVPVNRIETSRTDKYFVQTFAGSQMAGLVKKLKNRAARRLTPIYFFRLTAPEGFGTEPHHFASVDRPGDEPNRAIFRVDPMGRYVYVLYYPEKETRNETFTLEFSK